MFRAMLFGKYRGFPFSDIPTNYLHWLLSIDITPELRATVEQEFRFRDVRYTAPDPPSPPPSSDRSLADIRNAVKHWFGRLARRYHPDSGGTDAEMRVVNHAYESLKEILGF